MIFMIDIAGGTESIEDDDILTISESEDEDYEYIWCG